MSMEDRKLPGGWKWVKLGKACDVIAGQSPPGETYRKSPDGLPFFQGKADFGLKHPIARTWCVSPVKIALSNDILISVRAPVGPTNVANVKCCIGRGLAAIRCGSLSDFDYILWTLKFYESHLARLGSGSTFSAINRSDLENLIIPLPPLPEQKRIAAILNEQMSAVEKARAAAEARLEAAKALPAAYLREVFESKEAKKWKLKPLHEIATLLPSKSIASDGDAEVRAITTACLSENGFLPSGVKSARMWSNDAANCVISPGEVLIARSNTPELVGRVAMFTGEPAGIVASDLTIRIWPNNFVMPEFLTAYLSSLYITGYWKGRSGGASGTMKKITRGQIMSEKIPCPPPSEQKRTVIKIGDKMRTATKLIKSVGQELESIKSLPSAILRKAFNGEL